MSPSQHVATLRREVSGGLIQVTPPCATRQHALFSFSQDYSKPVSHRSPRTSASARRGRSPHGRRRPASGRAATSSPSPSPGSTSTSRASWWRTITPPSAPPITTSRRARDARPPRRPRAGASRPAWAPPRRPPSESDLTALLSFTPCWLTRLHLSPAVNPPLWLSHPVRFVTFVAACALFHHALRDARLSGTARPRPPLSPRPGLRLPTRCLRRPTATGPCHARW
jgi:hypothetical protein